MSKFRQNPINKDWTIISTERKKRPVLSAVKRCPFCSGSEDWTGPDHEKDISELPLEQVGQILQTYLSRYNFYKKERSDFYIHLYNNAGKEAGASIKHPHSQLVVFNQIPRDVVDEIEGAKGYFEKTGKCPYCDLLERELGNKERLVLESEFFVVLTPFESEWPYEITIFPKNHQADFGLISEEELSDFAFVLQQTLRAYNKVLSTPSRNFWIHSLPIRETDDSRAKFYHWHLDLVPRIKTLGGLELGAGIMVDDRVGPEEAALQLRASLS